MRCVITVLLRTQHLNCAEVQFSLFTTTETRPELDQLSLTISKWATSDWNGLPFFFFKKNTVHQTLKRCSFNVPSNALALQNKIFFIPFVLQVRMSPQTIVLQKNSMLRQTCKNINHQKNHTQKSGSTSEQCLERSIHKPQQEKKYYLAYFPACC